MASESIATLRSLGEDALIERLCAPLTGTSDLLAGPGDDCAVLRTETPGLLRLLKTDCVVEGVHFAADTSPERIGWKAAARAVSDFAAMGGGLPRHALVTLIAPPDRTVAWAEGIYAGLGRCAERFGFGIVGGELRVRRADATSRSCRSVSRGPSLNPPAGCAPGRDRETEFGRRARWAAPLRRASISISCRGWMRRVGFPGNGRSPR